MQEEIGLEVVTDGEFRRGSYWGGLWSAPTGSRSARRCSSFATTTAMRSISPHPRHGTDAAHASACARRIHVPSAQRPHASPPKITLPAPRPCTSCALPTSPSASAYADAETFFADLVAVFAQEIADLAAAGCRYLQIDEIAIAMLCDPAIRRPGGRRRTDALVDLYIASSTARSRPVPTMSRSASTCAAAISAATLSRRRRLRVRGRALRTHRRLHFLLEYDTPRAGTSAPLRFVPVDKAVVLGLISSKTPALEDLETLRRRVDDASRYHRPRPAGDQPAMRLRQQRRRQSTERGGGARQARAGGRSGAVDLGLGPGGLELPVGDFPVTPNSDDLAPKAASPIPRLRAPAEQLAHRGRTAGHALLKRKSSTTTSSSGESMICRRSGRCLDDGHVQPPQFDASFAIHI